MPKKGGKKGGKKGKGKVEDWGAIAREQYVHVEERARPTTRGTVAGSGKLARARSRCETPNGSPCASST